MLHTLLEVCKKSVLQQNLGKTYASPTTSNILLHNRLTNRIIVLDRKIPSSFEEHFIWPLIKHFCNEPFNNFVWSEARHETRTCILSVTASMVNWRISLDDCHKHTVNTWCQKIQQLNAWSHTCTDCMIREWQHCWDLKAGGSSGFVGNPRHKKSWSRVTWTPWNVLASWEKILNSSGC